MGNISIQEAGEGMDGSRGNWLMFLGTAGARMVMSRQLRSSAGIVLALAGRMLVIDPGPGTLARFRAVDPPLDAERLDAVILSHRHIDHSTDANVMIECMTAGGTRRRGAVFAPGDCLDAPDPVVFYYLRPSVEQLITLLPDTGYELGAVRFHTSGYHAHPVQTLGFSFSIPRGRLSIVTDGAYTDRLAEYYAGSDVMVINVVRHGPGDARHAMHLCIPDVHRLIETVRPRVAILSHFGLSMLRAAPDTVARGLSQSTGVCVLAAHDGQLFDLGQADSFQPGE